MKIHKLKIHTEYLNDIESGAKKFEIRKNDRDFKVGDVLFMTEVLPEKTPRHAVAFISYISNYEQKDNYVVLGLENIYVYDESEWYSR